MTVALNPAASPVQAKTGDGAANTSGKASGFDQLLKPDDPAETPTQPLTTPSPAAEAPEASLEALLQSLRTAFLPDAATLVPGKSAKRPAESGGKSADPPKDASEGDDDAALTLLALPQFGLPAAPPKLASAPNAEVEGVSAKTGSHGAPVPIDLSAAAASLVPASFPADLLTMDGAAALGAAAPADLAATSLDRLVDTARDAAWLDRLSRDIAESAGSGDRLRFRMLPPTLGALDVTVERQAAGLSVNLTTHSAEARNLFVETRQQMVDGLKAQGVPLVQLHLTAAGEDQAGHRPPTFFAPLIEVAGPAGTDLAAQPVETMAGRTGRFA